MLKMVSHNLLIVEETEPWEYSFCQFHDGNRHREPKHLDMLSNAILINECARNFRYFRPYAGL